MEIAKRLPIVAKALHAAVSSLVDEHPTNNSGEFRFTADAIFTSGRSDLADQETEDRKILTGLIDDACHKTGVGVGLQSHLRLDGDELILQTSDLQRFYARLPTVEYVENATANRISAASRPKPRFR